MEGLLSPFESTNFLCEPDLHSQAKCVAQWHWLHFVSSILGLQSYPSPFLPYRALAYSQGNHPSQISSLRSLTDMKTERMSFADTGG